MRARTQQEVCLQFRMLLEAWKMPIFASLSAISSRVAKRHSANVLGVFECGSTASEAESPLNLSFRVSGVQREEIAEPQLPRIFARPHSMPQSVFGQSSFLLRNGNCS